MKEPQKSPIQVRSQAELPHDMAVKQPPMRYSDAEMLLLKQMFGGDERQVRIKLLRKVFLPEYDPHAPIQQNIDLWMTVPLKELTLDEAMIRLYARNEVITHVEAQLNALDILANKVEETPQQQAERIRKNSTQ